MITSPPVQPIRLALLLLLAACSSSDKGGKSTDSGDDTGTSGAAGLTHITTWTLDPGTHRPEIALTSDGDLLVIVVEHLDSDEGRVSHMGYRFDTDFSLRMDPFTVALDTDEYGHPADHRIALVDDELIVVYQSLIADPDAEDGAGPAEDTALEQSLLIARFDAATGSEIDRQPIVAHTTDFGEDNFPDHCVLWHEDRLLVSTGTRPEEASIADTFRIREVDPAADWPDNVLATHTLSASTDTLPSVIGNSLVVGPDERLWMWGSTGPESNTEIKASPLGADFAPGTSTGFAVDDREQTFPTGVLVDDDGFWVGHISRDRGGDPGLDDNPYHPRLMRVSADLDTVFSDEAMPGDDPGASHVHPHLARSDDRLYLAWSQMPDGHTPQVVIEVFEVSDTAD